MEKGEEQKEVIRHHLQHIPFEEIFKKHEARIHYHIHKLGIHDTNREFYMEGLYALWIAYKNYRPEKGSMDTYFNYMIRFRLIDLIRKKTRQKEKEELYAEQQMIHETSGNRHGDSKKPIVDAYGIELVDSAFWEKLRSRLTNRQWTWVYHHIILEKPLKEIAEEQGVSYETVKGWGKEARKRIREMYKKSLEE